MTLRLTRAVKWLMIVCFGMFVLQQTADRYFGGNIVGWLALVPSSFAGQGRFWQVVTYAFLHGDVMHLFLNLLMLAFIGSELEALWGIRRFLRYYFFCAVSAGLLYLFLQIFFWRGDVPMVGASGAIYGLLMAYGLIFGERTLLFMLMFPMKAKHFVWILAGLEFFTTVFGSNGTSALAGSAHLGGMLAGFGYLWVRATMQLAKKRRQAGPAGRGGRKPGFKPKRPRNHLKLIIDNERDMNRALEEDSEDGPKTWH